MSSATRGEQPPIYTAPVQAMVEPPGAVAEEPSAATLDNNTPATSSSSSTTTTTTTTMEAVAPAAPPAAAAEEEDQEEEQQEQQEDGKRDEQGSTAKAAGSRVSPTKDPAEVEKMYEETARAMEQEHEAQQARLEARIRKQQEEEQVRKQQLNEDKEMRAIEGGEVETEDDAAAAQYPVGWFSKLVCRYPVAGTFTMFLLAMVLALPGGMEPERFSASWEDLSGTQTRARWGFYNAKVDAWEARWDDGLPQPSTSTTAPPTPVPTDLGSVDPCVFPRQSFRNGELTVTVRAKSGGGALGNEAQAALAWIQRELTKMDGFDRFCYKRPSLGFLLDHFDEIDANKNDALNADELLGVPWGADAFLGDGTVFDMWVRKVFADFDDDRSDSFTRDELRRHSRVDRVLSGGDPTDACFVPWSSLGATGARGTRAHSVVDTPLQHAYYDDPTDGGATHCPCAQEFDGACSSIPLNASEATPLGLADASVAYFKGQGSKAATEAGRAETLRSLCRRSAAADESSDCDARVLDWRREVVGENWRCDTLAANYASTSLWLGLPLGPMPGKVGDLTVEDRAREGFACPWGWGPEIAEYRAVDVEAAGGQGKFDEAEEIQDETQEDFGLLLIQKALALGRQVEKRSPELVCTIWTSEDVLGGTYLFMYFDSDLNWVMLSIFIVLAFLAIVTRSFFITFIGIFEIIISFPVGLTVYYFVMNQPYATYLMYNALFIIMGIGADDIFVFMDAWKQSALQPPHISGSLETRFAWAYNRAASAMLATSITTFVAFSCAAFSPIWDIRSFGVVAGVMVLCDFLLVITLLPCGVIIYERHLNPAWAQVCQKWAKKRVSPGTKEVAAAAEVGAGPKPRKLEVFFGGTYADFIINNASLITAFFAVLMTASLITAAMGVQLDDGAFEIFEPEHIYTRSRDTRRNKFYQRPNQDPIVSHLFYGLKKENPWNNDGLHPASRDRWEYRGQVYDKKFDLFSQQEAFMTACREYHGSLLKQGIASTTYYQSWDGTITFPKTYYCWMEDFAAWAPRNGYTFPVDTKANFIDAIVEWSYSEAPHGNVNLTYASDWRYPDQTGFSLDKEGSNVNFAWAGVDLKYNWEGFFPPPTSLLISMDDKGQIALEKAEKSSGMKDGFSLHGGVSWKEFIIALLNSAMQNLGIALVAATGVILVATKFNWHIAAISFVTLLCIMSEVLMTMVVFGMKINMIEGLAVGIAAGMAVDYLLHLAHSFAEQPHEHREDRVRGALKDMGISIVSGCGTTVGACSALLLCDMAWFSRFGKFLFFIVFWAFVTSMSGLMALFAALGPHRGEGFLPLPHWLEAKLNRPKPASAQSSNSSPSAAEDAPEAAAAFPDGEMDVNADEDEEKNADQPFGGLGLAEELDENGNPKKLYGFDARLITDGGVVL